jgi:hypothetical protein
LLSCAPAARGFAACGLAGCGLAFFALFAARAMLVSLEKCHPDKAISLMTRKWNVSAVEFLRFIGAADCVSMPELGARSLFRAGAPMG